MQRLVLAVLAVAIVSVLVAHIVRSLARGIDDKGGVSALTTGGTMQKVAFFLLLCLIVYVSATGVT